MINFRFHLISLIAVFLALAVGVVMGYGVLGQPTVDTLQGRVNTVEARANAIRAENDRLREEQGRLEALLQDMDEFAATGRLAGAAVAPVAMRGIDEDPVVEAVELARRAGADVPGVLWLEDKWALRTDDDAAELAAILETTSTSRPVVRDVAARALATRLASGPSVGRTDLLADLEAAGFVSLQDVGDVEVEPATFDGGGSRVLLVGGDGASVPAERGIGPLTRALVSAGRLVVVADVWAERDDGPARGETLSVIRSDPELADQVATVDDLDTAVGPITVVLVLGDVGLGAVGHYGFGVGAERLLPAWWGV